MAYVFLLAAIAVEVAGTSLLGATHGGTRLWPTVAGLTSYVLAFLMLAQAVKHVPVGVAYALWSGLGTLAVVTISVTFLGEAIGPVKVVGLALVVAGVVVLNLDGVSR